MSENSWIKPRSEYEKAAASQASSAITAADRLRLELKSREADFSDHGFEIHQDKNLVSVKIGSIDIMRVVFGYGGDNLHKVTDGAREAGRETLSWDCRSAEEAATKFKNQLSSAADYFYKNQDKFRALGII